MSRTNPLAYAWRLSRYEPELRMRDSPWDSWTSISDVGDYFNGIRLTMDEYLRVEGLYLDAVGRFAREARAKTLRIVDFGERRQGVKLSEGAVILVSDLAPVVRANLREEIDCALESTDGGFQVETGYDLYVRVGADRPCVDAVRAATQSGLSVEYGVTLVRWEDDF